MSRVCCAILDPKQRKAIPTEENPKKSLRPFKSQHSSESSSEPAPALCQRWAEEGFLVVANASNKARGDRLANALEETFYK